MPFNFNSVHLAGTLTRDPELKFTPKGTAVCDIGLAVNRVWKNDQGEKMEEVCFIDCSSFGKTAETIGEYCKKGHTIFVEGSLTTDSWEDKTTGQKRSKTKVKVDRMHFVSKPNDQSSTQPASRPAARQSAPLARQPAKPPVDPDLDDPDDSDGPPF